MIATLWDRLLNSRILKNFRQENVSAECMRFKNDPAFQQYMDSAKYSLITQMWALTVEDVERFQELKRCQQALEGLDDFVDTAILDETMKNRMK